MNATRGEFIRRAHVLVVDDDDGVRGLLSAFLAPMGCKVTEVADGREACRLVEDGRYDAVLLDLNMPGMNGFDVLARIREFAPVEDLPVLMITGQDDAETHDEALRLRANDFLAKPIRQADVTARMGTILAMHWARLELKVRLAELHEAQEAKDLLINCVIHDLKGPLTSAKGFVELALDREPEGATSRQLRRAAFAIDRTIALAADAVAVARMEEEGLRPRLEIVDVAAIARERIETLAGMAEAREVTLGMASSGRSEAVGDAGLLSRILDNLATNALKHTPAGGRVTVEVATTATEVLLTVRDTGEGIPKEWLGRIFDKFAQVDLRRLGHATDTGLGLTFCKLATEVQGGTIRVTSEAGQGSAFTVALKSAPQAARADGAVLPGAA